MIKQHCPLCRSRIDVTEFKPMSRLSCGKCHSNLHIRKDGSLGVGDPPFEDDPLQELKREFRRKMSILPIRQVATWLVVVSVLGWGGYQFFGPAERLDRAAEKAAKAIAEGDAATVEALADPESVADVRRWYESVHPRLNQFRKDWVGKVEVIEAVVTREDRDQGKGTANLAIHPDFNGARDVSLADPSSATATAASSQAFEEGTEWTLTRWGRWKLDGKAMASKVPRVAVGP